MTMMHGCPGACPELVEGSREFRDLGKRRHYNSRPVPDLAANTLTAGSMLN